MGAVLVPGDHDASHLVVQGVLAGGVPLVVGAVEPLDHHLGDAAAHAEPDRGADADDVGGLHLLEDLRPLIAVAFVGGHAERHVVIDDADDLGLDAHPVPPMLHVPHQRLGVRDLR